MQLAPKVRKAVISQVYRTADDYELDVPGYRAGRAALLDEVDAMPPPPLIEILGFPGCPMTPDMTRLVRSACAEVVPRAVISSVDLSKLAPEDDRLRWAAPTVLVDGRDLFGSAPAAVPAIACRVYPGGLPNRSEIMGLLSERVRTTE